MAAQGHLIAFISVDNRSTVNKFKVRGHRRVEDCNRATGSAHGDAPGDHLNHVITHDVADGLTRSLETIGKRKAKRCRAVRFRGDRHGHRERKDLQVINGANTLTKLKNRRVDNTRSTSIGRIVRVPRSVRAPVVCILNNKGRRTNVQEHGRFSLRAEQRFLLVSRLLRGIELDAVVQIRGTNGLE